MKKVTNYLNGMKSRCFVLFVCLSLMVSITSCNEDYFENNLPEKSKQLSKADLIEQALSRIPQTRANSSFPVIMITEKSVVSVTCIATEPVKIYWSDGEETEILERDASAQIHTYSDNEPHVIFLEASKEAISDLYVHQNELTYLLLRDNTNLLSLLCSNNNLDELDLTGCPKLENVWADVNELSSIDLTSLSLLRALGLACNHLTSIDLSKNLRLENLSIGENPMTDLDLTKNTWLRFISMKGLPIETLNNLPISNFNFAAFQLLHSLNLSDTPFTSLDLSNNPFLEDLYISGTAITQLDVSNLRIRVLEANNSQLTNLKYTSENLVPAFFIKIDETPFEEIKENIRSLIFALPDRHEAYPSGFVTEGKLYTNSLTYVSPYLFYLSKNNWVVNP